MHIKFDDLCTKVFLWSVNIGIMVGVVFCNPTKRVLPHSLIELAKLCSIFYL